MGGRSAGGKEFGRGREGEELIEGGREGGRAKKRGLRQKVKCNAFKETNLQLHWVGTVTANSVEASAKFAVVAETVGCREGVDSVVLS